MILIADSGLSAGDGARPLICCRAQWRVMDQEVEPEVATAERWKWQLVSTRAGTCQQRGPIQQHSLLLRGKLTNPPCNHCCCCCWVVDAHPLRLRRNWTLLCRALRRLETGMIWRSTTAKNTSWTSPDL